MGKMIPIREKKDLNEDSRNAFLEQLHGRQEKADGLWLRAATKGEPWAILNQYKQSLKSSLLDERQDAEAALKSIKGERYLSRREKLKRIKEARLKRPTLLITEDKGISLACQGVENLGLIEFNNPKIALEHLKHESTEVMIIDFDLPLANGLQFLHSVPIELRETMWIVCLAKAVTSDMIKLYRWL